VNRSIEMTANLQSPTLPPFAVQRRPSTARQRRARFGGSGRYSAEEILEALRRWERKYGRAPISIDWEPARARRMGQDWRAERFLEEDWPTTGMVRWQFGGFNDALREAGLCPRRSPTRLRPNLSGREAITAAIIEWTRRYGDVPTMADWDPVRARRLEQQWRIARYHDGDWPSARSVSHHFGSFAAAVTAAGLVPRPRSATQAQRDTARGENRRAVAMLRARDAGGDVSSLAAAVRAVAASRDAGDPVALHAALIDVAAAALAYAEVATS
jgi:HNH endonuclease